MQQHRGGLILAMGIISLVTCQILGPITWLLGNSDLAEMDRGVMDPEGRGLTDAGRICGMVATGMLVLGFLVGIAMLLAVFVFGFTLA